MMEYALQFLFVSAHLTLVSGGWKEFVFGVKGSHAITKGERSNQPQDSLLLNMVIFNNDQPFMLGIIGGTYCYPNSDTIDDQPPIVVTMYEALDMDKGPEGGQVFQKSGGVGKNQVCISIRSVWGGSYKYKFKVYGYQRDLAAKSGSKQGGNSEGKPRP